MVVWLGVGLAVGVVEVEDRGSVSADLVDFDVEFVCGLTDGVPSLEE